MRTHTDGNQAKKRAKIVVEIKSNYYSKAKPTEKAKEHFERKAYTHGKNTQTNADGKEKGHEQC